MTKLNKDFFIDNELLFWDQSKNGAFCPISKKAYQVLERSGIAVYSQDPYGLADMNRSSPMPKSAYVICERAHEQSIIRQLIQNGVRHILFHPLRAPSSKTLSECRENGVEAIIGCPMMVFGKGPCKVHALFC